MRRYRIGVMGLAFYSGNKGCCALSYSFLEILNQVAERNNEEYDVYIFTNGWKKILMPTVRYKNLYYHMIPIMSKKPLRILIDQGIKKCDLIFDYTAGDSFSDIYGMSRFNERTLLKEKVISYEKPLVLGSQTYGPYKSNSAQKRAAKVLEKSYEIFSRDKKSTELVMELCGRKAIETTDIAFLLPYNKVTDDRKSNKLKIGINPSGLLWNGGYTRDNQFGLQVNYKEYLRKTITYLEKSGKWEVHLIPHVFSNDDTNPDNDLIPCFELHKEFPNTVFDIVDEIQRIDVKALLPMEIKSLISGMDVFTGARMHATIAAFSSGVPVIPFSYSRKFEGLYETFDYNYIVSATNINTEEAIAKTCKWIDEYEQIKKYINNCAQKIHFLNDYLVEETDKVIHSIR